MNRHAKTNQNKTEKKRKQRNITHSTPTVVEC